MGLFNLSKKIDKGLEIIDQVVPDVDARIKIHAELDTVRAGLMLSGKGAWVTKSTICFLVSMVVGCLCYGFMLDPSLMKNALDFSRAATPLIAVLIGVYGGGKALKNSKWSNRNGDGQ